MRADSGAPVDLVNHRDAGVLCKLRIRLAEWAEKPHARALNLPVDLKLLLLGFGS